MASGPQAPYVSVTRGTQNQPRSPHLSSLAECFLTSPAWAAAPAQTPASDKVSVYLYCYNHCFSILCSIIILTNFYVIIIHKGYKIKIQNINKQGQLKIFFSGPLPLHRPKL